MKQHTGPQTIRSDHTNVDHANKRVALTAYAVYPYNPA